LLDEKFAGGKNGLERGYNECARDGVKRNINKWYEECPTHSSSDDYHVPSCNNDWFYYGDKPSDCGEWRDFGYEVANKLFQDEFEGDCDNVFDFAEESTRCLLDGKFAGGENGLERGYNECARDGVKRNINKWYEECLNPDACKGYGAFAAGLIINDFCKIQSVSRVWEPKKIKRQCKEKAREECRDSLKDELKDLLDNDYSCDIIDDKLWKYYYYEDDLKETCRTKVLELMET